MSFPDFVPACKVCKQPADECRCSSRNEIEDDFDEAEEDYYLKRHFEDDE